MLGISSCIFCSEPAEHAAAVEHTPAAGSKPTIATKPVRTSVSSLSNEPTSEHKSDKSHEKHPENAEGKFKNSLDSATPEKPAEKTRDEDQDSTPLLSDPLKAKDAHSPHLAEPHKSETKSTEPPKPALRSMEDFKPKEAGSEPMQSKPAPAPRSQRHTASESEDEGEASKGSDVSQKFPKASERKTVADDKVCRRSHPL